MKDSNSNLELLEKTKEWLQKEGYPLELKTAKIFETAGYSIAQGEYYNDSETNKLREIDIIADIQQKSSSPASHISIMLKFVVECKSSKDKPWIFFLSSNKLMPLSINSLCESKQNENTKNLLYNLGYIDNLPKPGFIYGPERQAYGTTTAFKTKDAMDIAYNSCLRISQAIQQIDELGLLALPMTEYVLLKVPLVVVEGTLYNAYLSSSDTLLEKCNYGRLLLKRGSVKSVSIDIVSFDYLQTYLQLVKSDLLAIATACDENLDLIKKNIGLETLLTRWSNRT
jgi:hypothetical protein